MIGLSCLLTSKAILFRENECARPNCAFSQSYFEKSKHIFYNIPYDFRKETKWVLKPLISYNTIFEVVVWIPRASAIAPANLFSFTPS